MRYRMSEGMANIGEVLKEAMERTPRPKKPEQEPATKEQIREAMIFNLPLYTTPPQRKPLTNAEIRKWWASENGFEDCNMAKLDDFEQVIRAVEGKHGIKE